jgi:drug/metabolite transporter (DMT)-like permease
LRRSPVALGLLASTFFSVTFIVNRAIGLSGGHWYWTAVLRYIWVILLLAAWFSSRRALGDIFRAFRAHWQFWTIAGSIGVGAFYAPLTYATTRAPGWVVACTMQFTILATPLVLLAFGARVKRSGVLFLLFIFAGIVIVNLDRSGGASLAQLTGVLPVLIAAFAYPTGNQLLQQAGSGGGRIIPALQEPITADATARVLLLTLGSIPFWLVLAAATTPPLPPRQQWLGTLVVAISGTIGNALFLYARQLVGRDPDRIARVDATQASYTAVTLAGEVLFLNAALPGIPGFVGLALVVGGLAVYATRTGS